MSLSRFAPIGRTVAPAEQAAPDAAACASCGAALSGDYCSACGQPVLPRLTLRALVGSTLSRYLTADGTLVRTLRGLFTAPERVIGDVLRGRTRPYAGPIEIVLSGIAVAGLTITATGANLGDGSGIFSVLVPVLLAVSGRIVFIPRRYNFAEQVVANLYLIGTDALLSAGLLLLGNALPRALAGWVLGGGLAGIALWHVRGLARLHGGGLGRWLEGLATAVLALVGASGILIALVRIAHALGR